MKILAVIISIIFAQTIYAQNLNVDIPKYGELTGKYMLGGINIVDPGGEPQDTHFYLKITGNAALKLFNSIKSDSIITKSCPFKNECFTHEHKKSGQVKCNRETTKNFLRPPKCYITIDFVNKKIIDGVDIEQGDL